MTQIGVRRFALLWLLVCLIASSTVYAVGSAADDKVTVIIGFHDQVDSQLLGAAGAEEVTRFNYIPAAVIQVPARAVNGLARHPKVQYVAPDDEVFMLQIVPWGVRDIEAPLVHERGFTGSGVRLAVLDTGIDVNHRDLVVAGGVNTIDPGYPYDDDHGHGTMVAGVAAALDNQYDVLGTAPDVDLYAVKVLNANGSGTISSIIAGIDWSIGNDMQVINMSFGTSSYNGALDAACQAAWDAGLLLVAAAGSSPLGIAYPARFPSVIAVGGVDENWQAASSAVGPEMELMAPAVNIETLGPGDQVVTVSGTSFAAPHVAGTAALVWQAMPGWTNAQIRDRMNATAVYLGPDPWVYGNGLVNAYRAVPLLNVVVGTDMRSYRIGDVVNITVAVGNTLGQPVGYALVDLSVAMPSGVVINLQDVTGLNGIARFSVQTLPGHGTGTMVIRAAVTRYGYVPATAEITRQLRN